MLQKKKKGRKKETENVHSGEEGARRRVKNPSVVLRTCTDVGTLSETFISIAQKLSK